MIARIAGRLVRTGDGWVEVQQGHLWYEVLVPRCVQRHLDQRLGKSVELFTLVFLEGNPAQGRLIPRMLGFLSEAEKEFFELFCSVDGVGARKALTAMDRPVRDIAAAIADKDTKQLSTLPGIGPSLAERIVAKLHRKMAKFALLASDQRAPSKDAKQRTVVAEVMEALVRLGHPESEARRMIEKVLAQKRKPNSVEDFLHLIYQLHR